MLKKLGLFDGLSGPAQLNGAKFFENVSCEIASPAGDIGPARPQEKIIGSVNL